MRNTLNHQRRFSLQKARDLVASLEKAGVKLPESVHSPLRSAEQLNAARPAASGRGVVDVLMSEGHDSALSLAQERAVTATMDEAYSEAGELLGKRAIAAVRAAADDVTAALAPRALERIATLETLANETRNLNRLVRDGEKDLALMLAGVDVTAAELSELYNLRDLAYGPKQKWGQDDTIFVSSMWRNFYIVDGELTSSMSQAERYLAGIRAGGRLWFPTPAEAKKNADALGEEHATLSQHSGDRAPFADQRSVNAVKFMRASDTPRMERLADALVRAAPRRGK